MIPRAPFAGTQIGLAIAASMPGASGSTRRDRLPPTRFRLSCCSRPWFPPAPATYARPAGPATRVPAGPRSPHLWPAWESPLPACLAARPHQRPGSRPGLDELVGKSTRISALRKVSGGRGMRLRARISTGNPKEGNPDHKEVSCELDLGEIPGAVTGAHYRQRLHGGTSHGGASRTDLFGAVAFRLSPTVRRQRRSPGPLCRGRVQNAAVTSKTMRGQWTKGDAWRLSQNFKKGAPRKMCHRRNGFHVRIFSRGSCSKTALRLVLQQPPCVAPTASCHVVPQPGDVVPTWCRHHHGAVVAYNAAPPPRPNATTATVSISPRRAATHRAAARPYGCTGGHDTPRTTTARCTITRRCAPMRGRGDACVAHVACDVVPTR